MLSDEWLPRYRLLENFTAKWNGNGNGNAYDRGDYNSSFALRAVELKTRFDVYETLCPQQMLVHKGGQIKNWSGVCRDVIPTKLQCQAIQRASASKSKSPKGDYSKKIK